MMLSVVFAASMGSLAIAQDLFLAARPATPECPPLHWVKQEFGSGHWILNYTDKTWEPYMIFLGLPKSDWYNEFHTSDVHQYAMYENTFIMNHTIPLTHFHVLFEAGLTGKWEKNPYPAPTPQGLDPSKVKVNLTNFRNVFEKPGVPHSDSCWALRTDMPVVNNATGTPKEYLVTFWRELTSPIDMRCTLYITDPTTGSIIEPWATEMKDAKPFPGYSYRYFRKTVQSFDDALKRLNATPTGLRQDTYFY